MAWMCGMGERRKDDRGFLAWTSGRMKERDAGKKKQQVEKPAMR